MSCRDQSNPQQNEHVLQKIFEFLTLSDRKNARLVCKSWFAVCNHEIFTKKEAYCIWHLNDFEMITDLLRKSGRKTLNLKFCCNRIDLSSLCFWSTCGEKIESLSFYECSFYKTMMPMILEICVNLIEFTLQYGYIIWDHDENDFDRNLYLAQRSVLLPRENIVRPKLTTFCFELLQRSEVELKSWHMRRFASTFPELKIFKLNTWRSCRSNEDNANEYSETCDLPTFSMWVELFATKLKAIEVFEMRFANPFDYSPLMTPDFSKLTQYDFHNLKQLSLSLVNFSSISYENFHTIIAFKFWTCFAIVCDENNYETANLITVAALINENPQLEKLDIKFETRNLTNMGTFFVALVKSRLQSIIIQLEYNGSLPEGYATKVGSTLDTLPLNNSVRRLEIRHGTGDLCSFCVKYFRNIRCLKVLLSNADVDVIFKYLTNLKHLEIQFYAPQPSESVVIIEHLKYLEIRLYEYGTEPQPSENVVIVESLEALYVAASAFNILSAYQFPNLKKLSFDEYRIGGYETAGGDITEGFIEAIDNISQLIVANAPNVEFLFVHRIPYDTCNLRLEAFTRFFQSCLNFPKLRYVSIKISRPEVSVPEMDIIKDEMFKYLAQCPSLRTVSFWCEYYYIVLGFNIVNKKLELWRYHSYDDPMIPKNHFENTYYFNDR